MENSSNGMADGARAEFDPMAHFPSLEAANEYLAAQGQAESFAAIEDQGEYILMRIAPKPKADAKPEGESPAASAPKAKAKGKGKASAKASDEKAKAAIAKADAKRAKAKEAKAAKPAAPAEGAKDMRYSLENMPDREAIESGLSGMAPAMRDHFRQALEGKLPEYDIFALSRKYPAADGKPEYMETQETHKPFRKKRDELYALRNKGKRDAELGLKEALAWGNGKGTRMTCSSTIPLGRFHQQLILALKAKIAAKKAAARKAAKAAPEGEAAQPQA